MRVLVFLFSLGAFLLMAFNSEAATNADLFVGYASYRTNMTYLINNGMDKMYYYTELLNTANVSMSQDISIFVNWHNRYSSNLTAYETEAQSQNLSIANCIAIHSFLDTYATTAVQTLDNKLSQFYKDQLAELDDHLNEIETYNSVSEEGIFADLIACDDSSACLDKLLVNIAANYTSSRNYIQSLANVDHEASFNRSANDVSTSINDYLYDGLRQVVLVYNTGIECLENAGLPIN